MEFVFDNNSSSSAKPTMMASTNTFGGSSTVVESPRRTRKHVPSSVDEIEITDTRNLRPKKRQASSKVTYVKNTRKKSLKEFTWSWNKVGWLICAVLFLRLIFMDSGVIDYYDMENTLEKSEYQLELIKEENAELVKDIHEIKTNHRYQKKLAREHLGVIAKDEYLILFAKDS